MKYEIEIFEAKHSIFRMLMAVAVMLMFRMANAACEQINSTMF